MKSWRERISYRAYVVTYLCYDTRRVYGSFYIVCNMRNSMKSNTRSLEQHHYI